MIKKIKQLSKDSLIYGIGGVAVKGLSFFTMPIYTRIFLPEEYGALETVNLISSFLGAFLYLGLDSALSFFFTKEKSNSIEEQKKVVTSIFQLNILWGGTIIILATFLSPLMTSYFQINDIITWKFYVVSFASVFLGIIVNQASNLYRLLFKAKTYTIISIIQQVLIFVITLIFVLYFKLGIFSIILGGFIASILIVIPVWFPLVRFLDFSKIHSELWPRILKFGIPLLPQGFAFYIITASDRWFISHYLGQEQLGFYSIGARFVVFISMATNIFTQAWWPIALEAMHTDDRPFLRIIAKGYFGLGLCTIILLTCIAPLIVYFLVAPIYFHTFSIIGSLSFYAILSGGYNIVALGIWKKEKTFLSTVIIIGYSFLNAILNYLMVPNWGIQGAAYASAISGIVWILFTLHYSNRLWDFGYTKLSFVFNMLITLIGIFTINYFYSNFQYLLGVVVAFIIIIVICWVTLRKENYIQLLSFIKKKQ